MRDDTPSTALAAATTRRRVVATGAKLAYAAPLVAATMKLTAGGAGAISGVSTDFCPGNQSPKQCPESSGVQYTCKNTLTCPTELQQDVEVICGPNGPFCAKGPEHTPVPGCEPLLCSNEAG